MFYFICIVFIDNGCIHSVYFWIITEAFLFCSFCSKLSLSLCFLAVDLLIWVIRTIGRALYKGICVSWVVELIYLLYIPWVWSYDHICLSYSCLILTVGNPSLSKKCIQDLFLPSKYKLLAKTFLLWTKNPPSLQCKVLYHQISFHFCCPILLSNVCFCAVFQTLSKLMTS